MLVRGDILVVHSKTIIGKIIRWVTNSWASHVAVYVGEGLVFEAKPGGAGLRRFSDYYNKNYSYKVFRLNIATSNRELFIVNLLNKTGMGYDYGQILGIAIKQLFKVGLKADNKHLAICSEIIYKAAQESGILVPSIKAPYITPHDFLNWKIASLVEEK